MSTPNPAARRLADSFPDLFGDAASTGAVLRLALDQITPNPFQPRQTFREAELRELADSLREHGQFAPVLVRPAPNPAPSAPRTWQLIAGERRWRAARLAGLSHLDAIERAPTDEQMRLWALIENEQRQDLNPVDQAEAYRAMMAEQGWSQNRLAKELAKPKSLISYRLALLDDPLIADAVRSELIGMRVARDALSQLSAAGRRALIDLARSGETTNRDVTRLARQYPSAARQARPASVAPATAVKESEPAAPKPPRHEPGPIPEAPPGAGDLSSDGRLRTAATGVPDWLFEVDRPAPRMRTLADERSGLMITVFASMISKLTGSTLDLGAGADATVEERQMRDEVVEAGRLLVARAYSLIRRWEEGEP